MQGQGKGKQAGRFPNQRQIIAEIVTFPVGIPSDVTVRLAIKTVTLAVPEAFFQTVAGTLFAFPCGSIDRGAIPGQGKIKKIDEAGLYGAVKEKSFKNAVKHLAGSHIRWRKEVKLFKQVFNSGFFHRRGFFPFFVRFFRLFLLRMDRIREVIVIRKPEPVMEIIKSSSTRGIADNEARKDGMEMVLFEVSGPFGIGSDLKFHGKQDGAQHIGGKPWSRAEVRIAIRHDGIEFGEIQVPEFLHDRPCGRRE